MMTSALPRHSRRTWRVIPAFVAILIVETYTRTIGGLTAGVNLSLAVNSHFFIVPDVRYHYGSLGDEINNALHASLRVWRL